MKTIKVGRNADNDIVIAADDVSRYHADIILDDSGQYSITDHSSNGTLVKGNLLSHASCYISFGTPILFPGYRALDWNQVRALMNVSHVPDYTPSVAPPAQSVNNGTINQGMNFGETLSYFFQHYVDFSGRARRKEYWYMVLWNLIFVIPFPLYPIWFLATIIPSWALAIRRLHDQGLSGWMVLIGFVPVVGTIVMLILMCRDSEPGPNRWGPSPKYNR